MVVMGMVDQSVSKHSWISVWSGKQSTSLPMQSVKVDTSARYNQPKINKQPQSALTGIAASWLTSTKR